MRRVRTALALSCLALGAAYAAALALGVVAVIGWYLTQQVEFTPLP